MSSSSSIFGGRVPDWVSGQTYPLHDTARSLTNHHTYVRIVAGAGMTDPASDYTNWKPEDPNVPWRITTYTSGTGTYVPLTDNARCEVTIQGAGSSGQLAAAASFAGGGAAGATIVKVPLRIPIAGVAYVVGAGGAAAATTGAGNAGSTSKFAGLVAKGGNAPSGGQGGFGGVAGNTVAGVNDGLGNFYAISGGGGGRTSVSSQSSSPAGFLGAAQGNGKANSAYGHGSGGSSVFALGGDGGATNGANAVAGEKGSGGGGTDSPGTSGPGGDGFITVVEYGA